MEIAENKKIYPVMIQICRESRSFSIVFFILKKNNNKKKKKKKNVLILNVAIIFFTKLYLSN